MSPDCSAPPARRDDADRLSRRGTIAAPRAPDPPGPGVALPAVMNPLLDRALALCYPFLVVAAGAYLVLQPTPAVTYGRSLAFGVTSYFALVIAIAALAGRAARIPLPGRAILAPLALWCLWGAASWFWSAHPAYTAGELRREILFGAMTMAGFYIAACDDGAWRALVATAIAGFSVIAAVAVVLAFGPTASTSPSGTRVSARSRRGSC